MISISSFLDLYLFDIYLIFIFNMCLFRSFNYHSSILFEKFVVLCGIGDNLNFLEMFADDLMFEGRIN